MEIDQENNTQPTSSSSKKRPFSDRSLSELSAAKKRVVLGDITNTQNLDVHAQKPRPKKDGEFPSTHKPKCELNERFGDLIKCSYSSSVYQHLRSLEMEANRRPLPNYMEKIQKDITANMREVLVDWLVEVAEEYKLVSDTLYLTISYIDRFLSSHALSRSKLQLLGVSCMLIASKYEEVTPPHVEDFCYVTDNTCTKNEILDMEKDILKVLNFEMSTPTPKSFLRIFTRVAECNGDSHDSKFEFLNCYIAELSLLDYRCIKFLPSVVASSAVFLSRLMICPDARPWSVGLQCYSGYTPSDLKDCVLAIHKLLAKENDKVSRLRAVKLKYMEQKYKCVAELPAPFQVPSRYFEAI